MTTIGKSLRGGLPYVYSSLYFNLLETGELALFIAHAAIIKVQYWRSHLDQIVG